MFIGAKNSGKSGIYGIWVVLNGWYMYIPLKDDWDAELFIIAPVIVPPDNFKYLESLMVLVS